MKCKKCGHTTRGDNALANMAKHYRKKHPSAMKAKKKRKNASARGKKRARTLDRLIDKIQRVLNEFD